MGFRIKDKPLDRKLTDLQLKRLELPALIEHGRQALDEDLYSRAASLFREAVHRAPFRQDLRGWLAMAIEGSIKADSEHPRPSGSSLRVAMERERSGRTRRLKDDSGDPDTIADEEVEITPPGGFGQGSIPLEELDWEEAPPHKKPKHVKPSHFERRHQRGPLSAILLGGLVGFVLVGLVSGGVWIYWSYTRNHSNRPVRIGDRFGAVYEQARTYRQRGEYTLAIERLRTLPSSAVRDRLLAEVFMELGDRSYNKLTPNLEAAIAAYEEALKHYESPHYYNALGLAYRLSHREASDPAKKQRDLQSARTAFQKALERQPDHIASLQSLADVAIDLHDANLEYECYRRILDVAPADSPAAQKAQKDMQSRGYRL